jgi:hypothetical protein
MDFGIVADRDQMPDVWCLIDWIEAELEQVRPKGRGRRARSAGSGQRTRDAE